MEYICRRCGYTTPFLFNFKKHLKRKTLCSSTVADVSLEEDKEKYLNIVKPRNTQYECDCGKEYASREGLYLHKKKCKAKQSQKNDYALLKQEIDELKAKLLTVVSINNGTVKNTQNNIQINVNANTGDVKVRDFGCENMDALPIQLLETLFLDLKFRELLENLHCDPDYPENHNVRIKSTKRELMEIYRNNKWDVVTFVSGLNELLLQGQRIFKDYYRKNKDKILDEDMDEGDLREILKQLSAIERLSEDDIKPIRKEIQLMLESYRGQLIVG